MRSIPTLLTLSILAGALPAGSAHAQKSIVWDRTTLTQVAKNGVYPRMVRHDKGQILCSFESRGNVYVRESGDNGRTWRDAVLAAGSSWGAAANPELLQLTNHWILLLYNERPSDKTHPYAIRTSVSKDRGQTWNALSLAYTAGITQRTGCWEPAAVQLTNGVIFCFFANEKPYGGSGEQEISFITSRDDGTTWSEARTAAFRGGCRDGMPVPCILKNRGVVLAIEDNGLPGRKTFQPAIVFSSPDELWSTPADDHAARRWEALARPLGADVYAGAPYLVQMPDGATILSFQCREPGEKNERMVVYIGDERAKNFQSPSSPFAEFKGKRQLWNSLFVKDSTTVTALTSCDGVWAIDGHIEGTGG